MSKLLIVASVAAAIMGSTSAWALVNDHDRDDRHHSAPEPATIIGLALGAGAIGLGRWAWKRKKSG
jgi:hypothetical protein